MVSDKPLMRALLVDDDLVECEVKTVISMPASLIVSIHHRPTVVAFTASCGTFKLTNNCFDFLFSLSKRLVLKLWIIFHFLENLETQ